MCVCACVCVCVCVRVCVAVHNAGNNRIFAVFGASAAFVRCNLDIDRSLTSFALQPFATVGISCAQGDSVLMGRTSVSVCALYFTRDIE